MKHKRFLACGMLLLLAAGFAGAQGAPADAAAKLAKDINAINAGRAKASGETVTLTGWVDIKKTLVVPEGVTLDVTAEKAGFNLGNAALTVNGTVNARADCINVGSGVKRAVINGSGTINLKGQKKLIYVDNKKKLTLDGVTLVGVKDNSEPLVGIGKGGEFVLKSGAITGNTNISGNSGGGVNVYQGNFIMEGGAISGNSLQSKDFGNGGGVCVGGKGGMFIMKGGIIKDNACNSDRWGLGGGVRVCGENDAVIGDTSFIMEGGTISGNTAKGKGGSNGGGVMLTRAAFTMSGGEISGNKAQNGASLYVDNSQAKWGTDGRYTKGGASQTGGSDIASTDDTLVAVKK